MNKKFLIGFLAIILVFGAAFSGFAQVPDISDLQNSAAIFSETLSESLPFNSSLGLNWSDAYIGKFFPGAPPHFGAGGSFGVTTMELPIIGELAGLLGYELPFSMSKLPLPAYAVEGRIGGFFLPFDIGVKFGYLPEVGVWGSGLNTDYLMAGADIRYAVIDNLVLPKLSVGVGFNYIQGGLGFAVGTAQQFSYNDGSAHTLVLNRPEIGLVWKTYSVDVKAQISKSFLIITPYIGLGASYAWSTAGYEINASVTKDGNTQTMSADDIAAVEEYLSSLGLSDIDIDGSGISSLIKESAFSLRTFGGFSINLAVFKIDLTGLYSFLDGNFGGSVGLRFQL